MTRNKRKESRKDNEFILRQLNKNLETPVSARDMD